MNVKGGPARTIWLDDDGTTAAVRLPHKLVVKRLELLDHAADAILVVRGAPLNGGTGAYGLASAMREGASDDHLAHAVEALAGTRPTAVNLRWVLDRIAAAPHWPEVNDRVAPPIDWRPPPPKRLSPRAEEHARWR